MSEYALRLSDLARYAPALVATVRERVRRIIEGFHPNIRYSMYRELEMDITYQHVVSISRRLEGMRIRERKERKAKTRREFGTYNNSRAPVAARHGRGYVSHPIHSALPVSSVILATPRPQVPYYAPPVSSVPPIRDAFSGQSSRSGPIESQQPRTPRACFECGDTRHIMRDFPRLRRSAPPRIYQSPPIPQGPQASQAMITAPVSTPHAQPARGGDRTGRGRPRRGGQARYYALTARIEAIAFDSIIALTLAIPGLPHLEWRGTSDHIPNRVLLLRLNEWLRRGVMCIWPM
ncbi:uncharacterized protein [Nicotiana tomentosiformis]|uniref:uncharacterized protein n=1 Tax=Nicotiana tomentosiformis TaxID=4098 RepID=UPI00388C54EE